MPLSPRIRPDYLLLYPAPTPQQCLEAYATEEGVAFCTPYLNILRKAATVLPELPQLIATLPPEVVAGKVCAVLDGIPADTREVPLPDNLLGE